MFCRIEVVKKDAQQRTGIADGWVFIERPAWQLKFNLDIIFKVCSYAQQNSVKPG